jgi:hypothetical protein
MRSGRSTLILVVVFLGLLGWYVYDSRREPGPAADQKPKAFTVEADKIEDLTVKAPGGETTKLRKGSAGWEMVEPAGTAADQTEATSIAQSLSNLEIQRVIDENATDLAQYGLSEPKVEVEFRASGQKTSTGLQLGDKTPTGGELYAKTPDSKRVFLIASYLDSTFNKTPFALRDKAILKFERDKVTALEIVRPKETLAFAKEGSDWNLTKPNRTTGDYSAIEGIIGQIQSAQMTALTATEPKDLKEYGLDKPTLTATVTAAGGRHTLEVGKASDDGSFYARDAARPIVFTISKALTTDLEKPAVDYRKKDIFDFRSFNANRLELTRDNVTSVYEKVKGTGENAADKWQMTAPTKKDLDTAKFESALSQISGLRAQSFSDTVPPGILKTPAAVVTVKSDEGKKEERVTFGKSGTDTFAARNGESGAAKLETSAFDNAFKAFDEFK